MSDGMPRRLPLSDDAIRRALRPGPKTAPPTDFSFSIADAIRGIPQRRRWWQVPGITWQRQLQLLAQLALLIAVMLALIVGAIIAGSLLEQPRGGGPVVVARDGQLAVIDPQSGRSTPVLEDPRGIFGVARSTGGDLVSFWTGEPEKPGNELEVSRTDGTAHRRLAANVTPAPIGVGAPLVWSPGDRYLAAAVVAGGLERILVVDVESGDGWLVGPDDGADSPLWSPDGEWIAFAHRRSDRPHTIAVMRRDGSELRELTEDLDAYASGPTNWSSDGRWIYFDAGEQRLFSGSIYRVDAQKAVVEQVTHGQAAGAPALSPDDSRVAFLIWTFTGDETLQSVVVMNADGSRPHMLIENADLYGWSPDSKYILVLFYPDYPDSERAELLAMTPDGTERHVLLALDSCPNQCLANVSWGWPRP